MSFFPRSLITADPTTSFHPLFRLLDDFDNYSRHSSSPISTQMKSFTPKFDVKEVTDAYELHGELPGIEQKDVDIEFTDAHTLTIKGRTERTRTEGTRPAGFIEDSDQAAQAAITDGSGEKSNEAQHKATVEDENAETSVATKNASDESAKPNEPAAKFWVSERSVGEFSRSFTFPARVDQDHVKASMKNGVLSILVPKITKNESRKITIS